MRTKGDGRGRMGGRQKGSLNKVSADLKQFICKLIDTNAETIQNDLLELEPQERIKLIFGLFPYIIPKQSSFSVEEMKKAEFKEIRNLMNVAPESVIDAIAYRLKNDLENENKD